VGNAAFSVLLVQDIAAIPLIALVPLLSAGPSSSRGGLAGVGKVAVAIATVVVVGRYLTRPVLRVIARSGLREVFTGFALLLVIGIALIMQTAGISMALGAFLAGILLAGSEYRHALETDVEPFKGLLMGLFFMAVGMSIDFGLCAERPWQIAGLVMGFTVLKGGMLRLVARPLDVQEGQRWLFAALLAQGGEFAFVVFGVAGQANLLPGKGSAILTLVVALSMALTPLALLARDAYANRKGKKLDRPADVIDDHGAPVIIAGFGRFGQIVGRLLFASGVRATVLDHDPDQIDLLRKFGFRVFFGDATRLDLLRSAGAAEAKLMVVAVDDMAASLKLVEVVREEFPKLTILARARNVSHWMELRKLGVTLIERETFEAALRVGRHAFEILGVGPYEARERGDTFRRHNVGGMEDLLPVFGDETRRLSAAKAGREQLEKQFAAENAALDRNIGSWAPDDLTLEGATDGVNLDSSGPTRAREAE